jgi:hypothetical protein
VTFVELLQAANEIRTDHSEGNMITAPLFVYKNGSQKLWGSFRFAQLPAPGDRINITDYLGRVQRLSVMYVAHEPQAADGAVSGDHELAWVHAEWIDEFC